MRRGSILLVTAVVMAGCDGDRPQKPAAARACAERWNERAPASYRQMLEDIVSRDGSRRIRVEGSIPGTGLSRIGNCFVAQASTRVERNHVFIEGHNGRWRLEHPRLPTNRGGPMVLENLVQRALGIANAWVEGQGRLRIVQRDVPPQIGQRPAGPGATAPATSD